MCASVRVLHTGDVYCVPVDDVGRSVYMSCYTGVWCVGALVQWRGLLHGTTTSGNGPNCRSNSTTRLCLFWGPHELCFVAEDKTPGCGRLCHARPEPYVATLDPVPWVPPRMTRAACKYIKRCYISMRPGLIMHARHTYTCVHCTTLQSQGPHALSTACLSAHGHTPCVSHDTSAPQVHTAYHTH